MKNETQNSHIKEPVRVVFPGLNIMTKCVCVCVYVCAHTYTYTYIIVTIRVRKQDRYNMVATF